MNPVSKKGNDPERWEQLIESLDKKLQMGMINLLRDIDSYHFEEDELYITPGTEDNKSALSNDVTFQHLEILAKDAIRIDKLIIK